MDKNESAINYWANFKKMTFDDHKVTYYDPSVT